VLWTEVPESLKVLRSQRVRWQYGLGECISLNRDLFFKRGSGFAGWVALPFNLVLEWLGPFIEVAGYIFIVVTFLLGLLSLRSFLVFLLFAIGLGMLLSLCALLLEELSFHTYPKMRHIFLLFIAAIAENLGYRQLNSLWRFEGLVRWMLGRKPGWGQMTRTAAWQAEAPTEAFSGQPLAK
jgi:cellulose synthase/poly-beta-1,6-N-acetylglucosamine synthase-like glycosyltransferase